MRKNFNGFLLPLFLQEWMRKMLFKMFQRRGKFIVPSLCAFLANKNISFDQFPAILCYSISCSYWRKSFIYSSLLLYISYVANRIAIKKNSIYSKISGLTICSVLDSFKEFIFEDQIVKIRFSIEFSFLKLIKWKWK